MPQNIHHVSDENEHVLSTKGERGDQTELPGAEADHSAHILTSVQTEANLVPSKSNLVWRHGFAQQIQRCKNSNIFKLFHFLVFLISGDYISGFWEEL